jgi:3D (Asp-Asp-Asp) domain-containing protein
MKQILFLIFFAYVTQYGATGNQMANGQKPFLGAVACPRNYQLNTTVHFLGRDWVCADRTARRYDGRFDIFSTGTKEAMLKFGKKLLEVKI